MRSNHTFFADPDDLQVIHNRNITACGYRRTDGLWEIETRLSDVKSYDQPALYKGTIVAGEPVHRLRVRVVVDDSLTLRRVEAWTESAPFPQCSDIASAYGELEGLSLGAGFMREVRGRLGGVDGCTHLTDMLGIIAATAFQTIYPLLRMERGDPPGRPALIDGCHAFAADGEVVAKAWPEHAAPARHLT